MKKKKILVLSDHALSTSGVGTQTRHLINGLLKKGEWSFRQYGAAVKHQNYETVVVNPDFIIKPIDGFGNPDLIRATLATERPDAILIFTDPRFFTWLFDIEDEIHQMCPIAWWHVWDNRPYPVFNKNMYDATDLINCHSHLTYEMCAEHHPGKTNFVPHTVPLDVFYPLGDNAVKKHRLELLGPERADNMIALWINRNAKRKRSNDVLHSWKIFIDKLKSEGKDTDVTLIMHTDPRDPEGPNLIATSEMLGIQQHVIFSPERINFEQMNVLHNISDFCVNLSYAEGFGLTTLEAMQCGRPIVAATTGGLTRQVVDHRDGTHNGVALPIEFKSLVGSQTVPYIYEDYVSNETTANAYMHMYDIGKDGRKALGKKAREYVLSEFAYHKTIDLWHDTLTDLIENFEPNNRWENIVL